MKRDLFIFKDVTFFPFVYEVHNSYNSYLTVSFSTMSFVRKDIRSSTSVCRDKCFLKLDNLKDSNTNSNNSRKTTVGIVSKQRPSSKSVLDGNRTSYKLNSSLISTPHSLCETKKKSFAKVDSSEAKVGSLNASPKWSRIKNKFENASQKTKLTRSSSLPRENIETTVKSLTFKHTSKSLTRLNQENNLSCCEQVNSSQTALSLNIENKQVDVDSAQSISASGYSSVNIEKKEENLDLPRKSTRGEVLSKHCLSDERAVASKVHLRESYGKMSQGCSGFKDSVPYSSSVVARSLLPSTKSFITSSKTKSNYGSVHKSATSEQKLKDTKKAGEQHLNSKKITDSVISHENLNDSSSKMCGTSCVSITSSPVSDNKNSRIHDLSSCKIYPEKTLQSLGLCNEVVRNEAMTACAYNDNSNIIDSNKDLGKNTVVTLKGPVTISSSNKVIQSSNTVSNIKQHQSEVPNLLRTQSDTGAWTKILSQRQKVDKRAESKESKVAFLTSKFNALTVQDNLDNAVFSNTSDMKGLSKSLTTSNVPGTIYCKGDRNGKTYIPAPDRILTKSSTIGNMFLQSLPHKTSNVHLSVTNVEFGTIKNSSENNDSNLSKLFSRKQNFISDHSTIEERNLDISSVEEIDPVKCSRKMNVVQRAILSYEESLALLSPESQRRYLKGNGNSKLESEGEKLFLDIKENYSTPYVFNHTRKDKQDTTYCTDESDKFLASHKCDILRKGEENGVSATNLKASSLGSSVIRRESSQFQNDAISFPNYEGKNMFSSAETLEEPTCCSLYCNVLSTQAKEPEKTKLFVPHIVSKTPVPLPRRQMISREQPLYVNGCNKLKSACYPAKMNLDIGGLQKNFSLQPNSSFLWRNLQKQSKEDLATTENSDLYYDFNNCYSSIQFQSIHDMPNVHQVDASESYSHLTSKLDEPCASLKYLEQKDKYKAVHDGHNESESEDWMDISDVETNIYKETEEYSPTSTLKARGKQKKASCHKGIRRSWSQSLRDLAKGTEFTKNEGEPNDDWYSDDYNDVCVWEMFDGTDNSSGSTDTDHYYEPVYESLNKYLVDDDDDSDESYSISHSPDEAIKDIGSSSNTSLDCAGKNKPELPPTKRAISVSDNDSPTGLSKKAGEKIRQFKRNWSLTKSDIRLELTSKLNKIKIRKNNCNSAEIGVKVQESSSLACPKKKTLIKCILKQKNTVNVPDGGLSSKKDSPTFYVQLSVANEKQRPFSDSYAKEMTEQRERQNSSQLQAKGRKTSEPSVLFVKTYDNVKSPVGRGGRRGSLKNNIQRPKTPPPLPPVVVSRVSEKKALQIVQENSSNYQVPITKELSSNASNHSSSSGVIYSDVREKLDDNELKKSVSMSDAAPFPTIGGTRIASTQSMPGSFLTAGMKEEKNYMLYNGADSSLAISRMRSSLASSESSVESYHLADEREIAPTSLRASSASLIPPTSNIGNVLKADRAREKPFHENSINFSEAEVETLKSPFEEEPLYQFYQRDVLQRATMWYTNDSESDVEDDYFYSNTRPDKLNDEHDEDKEPSLKSQMSAMELIHGDVGGQRTLWCEVPEVVKSGALSTVTTQDRKLQEAMFEVITSEASYLKSLNILVGHFLQCPEFSDEFSTKCVLSRREKHILFSDVSPVREVSIQLLADLEKRWLQNIVISNVCDIIYEHSSKNFSVYVKYCSNQVHKDRMLKELKETKPEFVEILRQLESSPVCQGLDMHSFLMLPMQRITRLPLLIDAIFHRLTLDSPIYESCKMALATLNNIVAECNEGARRMERMEEMLRISHQLDFKDCKSVGLISSSRWLVKKGELTRLKLDTGYKRTFGRSTRWSKSSVYFFLFTDLLVITKKKSDESYGVLDYCPRNMMQVLAIDNEENSGFQLPIRPPPQYKNLFQLIMLNNHEGKTVEIILSCPLESDRTRWMDAVTPPISENPDERIYEEWDCPQVQCIHMYVAQQPDELSLEQSDVVNVFRKIADGWYEGERIRDGVRGWFPAPHTVEIISSHVRARNLRQRYRLLMLSQTWLEEQHKAQLISQGKGK